MWPGPCNGGKLLRPREWRHDAFVGSRLARHGTLEMFGVAAAIIVVAVLTVVSQRTAAPDPSGDVPDFRLDSLPELTFSLKQVIAGLQIHPELRTVAKVAAQT